MARRPVPAPPPPAKAPTALIGAVVLAAVLLVGLVVYIATRSSVDPAVGGSPSSLAGGGGIQVPAPADPDLPQVHLYEDFQCPGCGVLEATSGAAFTQAAEAGQIQLTYTLMSFLDGNLRNDSSSRAANAALCADDQGAFAAYHAEVYAHQPAQEGQGWTDDELVGFAGSAGISGAGLESFTSCLTQDTHGAYVEAMQAKANQDGITGTPRVFWDGTELTDQEMAALQRDPAALTAILAARP